MASAIEQLAKNMNYGSFASAVDLQKRIWFTLLALVVYRLGTHIPLPGINPEVIAEFIRQHGGGVLGMLDMFSGGALGRMTIFTLNVAPYISASIIIQLMTSISPHLEALKKEGETGRKKLNQYTRYATVLLAAAQGFGISLGLESMMDGRAVIAGGFLFRLSTTVTLMGSTLFIMWLGEQITARGIGNGISMIIFSGIVANLPQAALSTIELGRTQAISTMVLMGVLIFIAAVIGFIVFMEKSQRRLTIQYPKRQISVDRPATAETSHLPLKLNSAGVIPPIFASSLLLLPITISGFGVTPDPDSIFGTLVRIFSHGHPVYIISYIALIVFFAFFYTAIVFNPAETAENLRKMGAYIPGVRPGKSTADYLDYVLTRLTVLGAAYLAFVCIIPELIMSQVSVPFYFGGTSILIVVSVTIDTFTNIQSHLIAHQYQGLIRKSRLKSR